MKKLLSFLFCLGMFAAASQAQIPFSQTASNPTGAITNTGIDTMTVSFTNATYNAVVGIQPVITKASGTMAGTAVLYGSIDGTNFVATGDTLTLANQTVNTTIWTKTVPVYKHYRIKVGGATTVAGTAAAKLVALKP